MAINQADYEAFLEAFADIGPPPVANAWPAGNPNGPWLKQFMDHYEKMAKAVARLEKMAHLGQNTYTVGGPVLIDPKPGGGPDTAPPPPPPKIPPR